jgi:AraC-like DNA-binding protein
LGVGVHGPESRSVTAPLPVDGYWVGIRFRLGVMLQDVAIPNLVDGDMVLPEASHRSFWWKGGTWERPTYGNAEGLVARMEREDLIGREPLIDDAMQRGAGAVSLRTLPRRFYLATGLPRRTVRQIESARRAAVRLREGTTAADVTHELGYYDQPHLSRSMRRYLGRTPAELNHPGREEQLSLLYKTDAAGAPTLTIDRLPRAGEAA